MIKQKKENIFAEDLKEELQVAPPLEEVKPEELEEVSEEKIDAPVEEVSTSTLASEENAESVENSEKETEEESTEETEEGTPEPSETSCETEEKPKKKRRRRKKKIIDVTFENDIRYCGPMSYRWLRILAWVAIVCAQVAIILQLGMKFDAKIARDFSGFTVFLSLMGTLSVPLFLMANFALIINAKNGYKRLLVAYAFMALIIFSLFMLIYQRYLLGIMQVFFAEEGKTPQEQFYVLFSAFSQSGYLAFNIFIDLFLCTLFTFFVNYTPKKVFVGKKIIIFRLLALLPVAYEVTSIALKMLCSLKEGFVLPLYVSPFLTTKPPITFLVFVVLAFFIKNRERVFLKRGKTVEEYGEFLKTNVNSLHFSIAASVCMLIAAILDIILYLVLSFVFTQYGENGEIVVNGASLVSQLGFGHSVPLILVIPFIMLFSYTRTHKPSSIDMIIPLVGIIAFAICYVEGLYQFVLRLPQIINGLMH